MMSSIFVRQALRAVTLLVRIDMAAGIAVTAFLVVWLALK